MKWAPSALAANTGCGPAHSVIHGIGTPASSEAFASSNSSPDRRWVATKRSSSDAQNLGQPAAVDLGHIHPLGWRRSQTTSILIPSGSKAKNE